MRAAVARAVDEPVEVRDDVELAGPGTGEVRVAVRATGVCHSDRSILDGTVPVPLPCVPGHEGAGVVVGVGDDVAGIALGQPVILSWIPLCGACWFCRHGKPHLCTETAAAAMRSSLSIGGERIGAGIGPACFAEETVVPAAGVIPIPDDVPFEVAALVGCAVTTGVGAAVNTARVQPGSSVVVIGCGGVGISAIQGARLCGAAEIVAVDPVESRRAEARRFGATHDAHPDALPDVLGEVTTGLGFDFAFEVVGRPGTIRLAWNATKRGGTTTIVGAGRMDDELRFTPFELFYFERRLLGCVYGSADPRVDFPRLLRLWRTGRLDLAGMVTGRAGLDAVNDAFGAMDRGEGIRTVLEP
ncbi:MAG: alcohol dehydrogenase catalytic domain-containing protein [Acidimicrobiia bacterium]